MWCRRNLARDFPRIRIRGPRVAWAGACCSAALAGPMRCAVPHNLITPLNTVCSWKQQGGWFNHVAGRAEEIAALGFTTIWLPPFTQSVSAEVRCQLLWPAGGLLGLCGSAACGVCPSRDSCALLGSSAEQPASACCAHPDSTHLTTLQGYLPGDLYNLNSKYGSEEELIDCVKALQQHGIKVLGDAVSAGRD